MTENNDVSNCDEVKIAENDYEGFFDENDADDKNEINLFSGPEFISDNILEKKFTPLENIESVNLFKRKEEEKFLFTKEYEYMNKRKYHLLEKFVNSDHCPFKVNRCGIDYWYEDFAFAVYAENHTEDEVIDWFKMYDLVFVTFEKRYIKEIASEEKLLYIFRVHGNSRFFDEDFWLWSTKDFSSDKKEDNSDEEFEILNTEEDEEENYNLDTLPECEKKTGYRASDKKLFFSFILPILLISSFIILFFGLFLSKNKKLDVYSYEVEKDSKDLSPSVNPDFEKVIEKQLPRYQVYDLTFETTDGSTRVFENATYETKFLNYVVNIYADSYSSTPVGFCIFPRKGITSISGIESE